MNFKVIFDSKEFESAVEAVASRTIRRFASDVISRMKISFSEPKSGRFYKVSKTGRPHQASAPGQAPAVLTGFLTNSIQSAFPKLTEGVITIGAEYAEYLERGPRNWKQQPSRRPFVEPALEGALEAINSTSGSVFGRLI